MTILTDPWFFGSAFNNGWNLLFENKNTQIEKVLLKTNYIFLSHEHPDHFSIEFFKKYKKFLVDNNIQILFQQTIDNRVKNYLEDKLNLTVIECCNDKIYHLSKDIFFVVIKEGFIDSALLIFDEKDLIFNINDCDFSSKILLKIYKKYSKSKNTYIFMQFSFAVWRPKSQWISKTANEKINKIINIYNIFNPKVIFPFASFMYFSDIENDYLNSYVNHPKKVSTKLNSLKIPHVFLEPMIPINLSSLNYSMINRLNKSGVYYWELLFKKKKKIYSQCAVKINKQDFDVFHSNIRNNNNIPFLLLIRLITFKFLFGDTFLYDQDNKKGYLLNFIFFKEVKDIKYDLILRSSALKSILNSPYGIDTLSINGFFRESKNGFRRFIFSVGFKVLNLSGYKVGFGILFNFTILAKIRYYMLRIIKKDY